MKNRAGYEESEYGDLTSFERFVEWEGIPFIRDVLIKDVRTLDLPPWRRLAGAGAYIQLGNPRDPQNVVAYVCEIPPKGSLKPQKCNCEEMIFVLKGSGATRIWLDSGGEQAFEWQENSLFSPPINVWRQHFNGGSEPARFLGLTNLPAVFNLFHNYDFVFHNDFVFQDRIEKLDSAFKGDGTLLEKKRMFWESNFIPDIRQLKMFDWSLKGPGATNIALEMANNMMSAHITRSPDGVYKKAHRHGPGAYILVLQGKGYSLMWPEGEETERYDWGPGSLFSPPSRWFHQHFNTGRDPLIMLALKGWGRKFPQQGRRLGFTSTRKGGDMIEFEDEESWIRSRFEEELAREGIECRMPPIVPAG